MDLPPPVMLDLGEGRLSEVPIRIRPLVVQALDISIAASQDERNEH